jgi:formate/nitrite transporter FocA (FNT family)
LETEEITAASYDKAITSQNAHLAKIEKDGGSTGIIIGCVVGGLVIVGGVAWYIHSKKAKKTAADDDFGMMMTDTEERM